VGNGSYKIKLSKFIKILNVSGSFRAASAGQINCFKSLDDNITDINSVDLLVNYITIQIRNINCKVLLDSGADINVISEDFISNLPHGRVNSEFGILLIINLITKKKSVYSI
jgi:hypothetical protein